MRIELTKAAKKEIAGLEASTRERILKALVELGEHPERADLLKLAGREGEWRLRVGDWRVILELDLPEKVIHVLRVGHRREVYR